MLAGQKSLSQLRALDLSCNPIKVSGLLNLFDEETSYLSELRKLELFYCHLNEKQIDSLAVEQLERPQLQLLQLQHLNLSYNKLGELSDILLTPDSHFFQSMDLETLMLVECNLEDEFIEKTLVKVLPRFQGLRSLDLSHNFLERSYKQLMCTLYMHNTMITNVSLSSCQFYMHRGLDLIVDKIQDYDGFYYLKRLDLSSSFKGDE